MTILSQFESIGNNDDILQQSDWTANSRSLRKTQLHFFRECRNARQNSDLTTFLRLYCNEIEMQAPPVPTLLKMSAHYLSCTARNRAMNVVDGGRSENDDAYKMLSLKNGICVGTISLTFHVLGVP